MSEYENVAHALGGALADQQVHATLRERVKELTCLYSIAQLADRPDVQLDELLQRVVELLPPAQTEGDGPIFAVNRENGDSPCERFRRCLRQQSA